MFGYLARMWLIRRLFGGGNRRRGSGYGSGYGSRYGSPYGYGRRRQSGGFGWTGPFPTYSRRTRGGSRVSVSGCCLPIPLALGVGLVGAQRLLRHGPQRG
jgi:hypothetical protein